MIRRPSGGGWLALYRIDDESASAKGGSCDAPKRNYGTGWHETDKLLGGTQPSHWTSDAAQYTEGPLPQGAYRPLLYARAIGTIDGVKLELNGVGLGGSNTPIGADWGWIEGDQSVPIGDGGTATLNVTVQTGSGDATQARLMVGSVILQRER
jgi:hypothetical protein